MPEKEAAESSSQRGKLYLGFNDASPGVATSVKVAAPPETVVQPPVKPPTCT